MTNQAANRTPVPDETLHEILNLLEKAVRPRVLYRPDQQRMAEEAMELCQKNVRQALKHLSEALPAGHWLTGEIDFVLDEAVQQWDRFPF
ncbi:MAG: hypothetical protein IPL78_28420 [Chloroflexi bacterium]|nr:hypothetical protein [Chloroflexota bacterium]